MLEQRKGRFIQRHSNWVWKVFWGNPKERFKRTRNAKKSLENHTKFKEVHVSLIATTGAAALGIKYKMNSWEKLRVPIWRRQWHPTPVLLPGKSHGRRTLVGCSPCGRSESDRTGRLHFHFSLSCIGEGNGNLLQCSCLENPGYGGAWWAALYGIAQSRTRLKQLSSSSITMKQYICVYCVKRLFIYGICNLHNLSMR